MANSSTDLRSDYLGARAKRSAGVASPDCSAETESKTISGSRSSQTGESSADADHKCQRRETGQQQSDPKCERRETGQHWSPQLLRGAPPVWA